jgi:hypothetical protein
LNSFFTVAKTRDRASGARLTRTVWIAAFSLALIGGLFATKVTASMVAGEEREPDPTTVSTILGQDTLTTSDKGAAAYDVPPANANLVLPISSAAVLETRKFVVSRSSRRLTALNANRGAVKLPKPRPTIRLSKKNNPAQNGDVKGCTQPDGLGGILLSLSGSLRCG